MLLALTPTPVPGGTPPKQDPLADVFNGSASIEVGYRVSGHATWRKDGFFGSSTQRSSASGPMTYRYTLYDFDRKDARQLPRGASFDDALRAAQRMTTAPQAPAHDRGDKRWQWERTPIAVIDAGDGRWMVSDFGGTTVSGPEWSPKIPWGAPETREYLTSGELTRVAALEDAIKAVVFHDGFVDLRNGPVTSPSLSTTA